MHDRDRRLPATGDHGDVRGVEVGQGPINRKRALSHRESHKLKISMDVKHDGQVDNEDELYALRSGSDRSKSMDNLDDLEVRYSSLALCDTPVCES